MVHECNADQEIIRSYCLDTIVGITPTIEFTVVNDPDKQLPALTEV